MNLEGEVTLGIYKGQFKKILPNSISECFLSPRQRSCEGIYRDMPKVFGHCNFLLYISYILG
jgi:hypothetical protein